jgi:hypothetical protein
MSEEISEPPALVWVLVRPWDGVPCDVFDNESHANAEAQAMNEQGDNYQRVVVPYVRAEPTPSASQPQP